MPREVIMPKVDMDMTRGTIATWHVAEGGAAEKGEPLFAIETDKAAMEVESPDDGTLHHRAPEGSEVAIGEPVGWLYADGEAVGDAPGADAAREEASAPPDSRADVADEPAGAAPSGGGARVRATPRARSLAREAGLELALVSGSGPRGRVQADDVRARSRTDGAGAFASTFVPERGPLAVTSTPDGEGEPVVMIHGFASDSSAWAPLERHLGPRRLFRIDLPGHGRSPRRPVASFAALVDELRRAFDELDLERAHLIGHSLGGALCLALADARSRAVASLTLIAPAGLGPDIDGATLAGLCRASRAESLGPWLKTLVADEAIVTDRYVRLAMASRADPGLRAAQTATADALFPDGVQAFDLRPALGRVEVPTRIVWGRRDRIIPWRHALRAPGRVALHLFDGVGHLPQIERAEEVARIVPGERLAVARG